MTEGLSSPLDAGLRRLHLPTVRRRYAEVAADALAQGWSYPEYLERLIDEEIAHRQETRVSRATHRAGFPFLQTLEEFDFTFQRSIARRTLGPYLGPELIAGSRNLILWGPPGVGKTALCVALAYKAIEQGADARFVTCTDLLARLHHAREHGPWEATLAEYLEPDVLVLDEVGYLSYGPDAANLLFPIVDKRYLKGHRPILLTTNKDPQQWAEVLHDPDLAAAILDRLLHRGEILRLSGRSYRQYRPGQPPPVAPPLSPTPGAPTDTALPSDPASGAPRNSAGGGRLPDSSLSPLPEAP